MKPILSHITLHHVSNCTSFHVPKISANTSLGHKAAPDPEPAGCVEPSLTVEHFAQAVALIKFADAATRDFAGFELEFGNRAEFSSSTVEV